MKELGPYLGKYRGTVVNNLDPLQMGRVMATVTDAGCPRRYRFVAA